MEPAPLFKRPISLVVVLCILGVFSSCSEQQSTPPKAADNKGKTIAGTENRAADSAGATSSQKDSKEGTVVKDDSGKKESTSIAGPGKTQPSSEETKSKLEEKGDKSDEKKSSDANVGEKEEKQMTDEEIIAANEAKRKAALKEIIDKLGPPLVDEPEKLTKMDPDYPVWIDAKNKQVVLQGTICQTNAPLEMFAVTTGTKEHEAIVSVPTKAYIVHTSLLAMGAEAGKPVEFGPKPGDYKPATGTPIEIIVKWKNDKGEVQTARAQDWIKNVKTGKEMVQTWVFGGSGFWKDEQTGIEYYKAEGGDFICVSNFPSAMLDLPIESSQSNDELMFQANADRVPPIGTPVTLFLVPKPSK